jgi:hypothetical protein
MVDEARELIEPIRAGFFSSTCQGVAIIFCGLLIAKAIGELTDAVNSLDFQQR